MHGFVMHKTLSWCLYMVLEMTVSVVWSMRLILFDIDYLIQQPYANSILKLCSLRLECTTCTEYAEGNILISLQSDVVGFAKACSRCVVVASLSGKKLSVFNQTVCSELIQHNLVPFKWSWSCFMFTCISPNQTLYEVQRKSDVFKLHLGRHFK